MSTYEPHSIVHVQSVLPLDVVTELKIKTKEHSIKEAISKAVYHYLKCNPLNVPEAIHR